MEKHEAIELVLKTYADMVKITENLTALRTTEDFGVVVNSGVDNAFHNTIDAMAQLTNVIKTINNCGISKTR